MGKFDGAQEPCRNSCVFCGFCQTQALPFAQSSQLGSEIGDFTAIGTRFDGQTLGHGLFDSRNVESFDVMEVLDPL